MNIFSGLETIIQRDVPLKEHTWYALGGNAEYFARPQTVEHLQTLIRRCAENQVPARVLGFGSNLLVSDQGVRGVVIKLDQPAFTDVVFEKNKVRAGAGAALSKLVTDSVRKGLSGLEALTGIPGTVGGAVRMNAGGNYGDIGSCTEKVVVMDAFGNIFEKAKPELVFDYRWANITAPIILAAELILAPSDPEKSVKLIKEVWIYKKNSQPLNTRNAGCIFKNPRGMSAGALIDRAGLKGFRIGGAVVSDKHANFIIADTGCSSEDVKKLIEKVRQTVKEKFDVELELEIEIWD